MEKESRQFLEALKAYDKEYAITLYDNIIEKEPEKFIAWNNRAVNKVLIAKRDKNIGLAIEAKGDFNHAIQLAKKEGIEYRSAMNNLEWVDREVAIITKGKEVGADGFDDEGEPVDEESTFLDMDINEVKRSADQVKQKILKSNKQGCQANCLASLFMLVKPVTEIDVGMK